MFYVAVAIKSIMKADRNDFSTEPGNHTGASSCSIDDRQSDFLPTDATEYADRLFPRSGYIDGEGGFAMEEKGNYSANILDYHTRNRRDFCIYARLFNKLAKCALHGARSFFIFEIRILLSRAPRSIIRQQFIRQFTLLILHAF